MEQKVLLATGDPETSLRRAGRAETSEQQASGKRAQLAEGFALRGLERPRDDPPGRLTLCPQRTRIWNASIPNTESATTTATRRSGTSLPASGKSSAKTIHVIAPAANPSP